MVPADSRRISRVPRYSGAALAYMDRFRVRGSHPLRRRFPAPSATAPLCRIGGPTTPRGALPHPRFGLLRVRSPLLAQSLLFSLPAGTEMFQFPAFALLHQGAVTVSLPPGSPIRTSADHGAFASPRGFSQLITSFVASESHRHPPCALSCFLVSFAYMTLLLQVRSILVTSEKVCFNFLGESLYSFCNSSFAFPACQ